jgi:hypothetical protein
MRQFWTYTLARLALVAVAGGLLWLVGLRGALLIVLAFVISGVVSFFLLGRQRGAFAEMVDARARRIRERMSAAQAAEDAADEAARRAAEQAPPRAAEDP